MNIYYLIPTFLERKKPVMYLICLVGLAVLVAPIYTSILLLLYSKFETIRANLVDARETAYIIGLFVGLASMLFKVTKDWLLHQQEKKDLESQNLQSELKFLKSQINPHFFFNTLNNLYALTLKKSDLAPEIVLRLSEMMRYMLYECNEKLVSLEKEVNYVKNYIELEKLRQGNKFNVNFNLEGKVNGQMIAPLIFIPFLENSFKHGVNNQINSGFVNINMKLDSTKVDLEIENSKAPVKQNANGKKSGGIGLENVKRRLNLLYPNQYDLKINDFEETFKINLNINLN